MGVKGMWAALCPHPTQEGLSERDSLRLLLPRGPGTHRPRHTQALPITKTAPHPPHASHPLQLCTYLNAQNRPSLRHLEAGARTEPEGTTQCSFHPSPSQRAVSQLG